MKRQPRLITSLSLVVFAALVATGCSEYWWTRGQPPSVRTLVKGAKTRLQESATQYGSRRGDILDSSKKIESELTTALRLTKGQDRDKLLRHLELGRDAMMSIEDKLSPGSRPAFGELSIQLNNFIQQVNQRRTVKYDGFGIFVARTIRFLASEMTISPPVKN